MNDYLENGCLRWRTNAERSASMIVSPDSEGCCQSSKITPVGDGE